MRYATSVPPAPKSPPVSIGSEHDEWNETLSLSEATVVSMHQRASAPSPTSSDVTVNTWPGCRLNSAPPPLPHEKVTSRAVPPVYCSVHSVACAWLEWNPMLAPTRLGSQASYPLVPQRLPHASPPASNTMQGAGGDGLDGGGE